jgi:hypothetical protein
VTALLASWSDGNARTSRRLYAPLRTAIYLDAAHRTQFAVDEPRTLSESFASAPIAQVGFELNCKLNALLEELDVPVRGTLAGRV